MNSTVTKALNKILGDFIENLDSEQLNISLFKGQVSLENLSLKPNILHILGLPFNMVYGRVGSILVSIPWTSLLSSALTVEVSDVLVFCTPRVPESWSEDEEKAAYYTGKKSAVDQFELLLENELMKDNNSKTGYFSDLAFNIANNVQVKLKHLCFRYEDISANFAMGLSLETLQIFTCNQNWKQEFITSADVNYKVLKLQNFLIFCDFNNKNSIGNEKIQEKFLKYAKSERKGKNFHDYFLKPFSFEVKATISERLDYKIPKISCSFESNALQFNFDAKQIRVIFQMIKFLDVYSKFKIGILQKIEHKNIEMVRIDYVELYNDWKKEEVVKRKEELEKELSCLEKDIELNDIRTLREEARSVFEKRKTIELKKNEIKSIQNEGTGTLNRISGFFSRNSKEIEEKTAQDKADRIAKVENEIDYIKNSETQSLILSKSISEDEKNWEKFVFCFQLDVGEITLANASNVMLSSSVKSLTFTLSKKLENLQIEFKLGSFEITEASDMQFYSKVFESAEFFLKFLQNPTEISVHCGDIYICMIIPAFQKIYSVFIKEFSADVTAELYLQNANENIFKRIEDGQNFLTNELTKTGPSFPVKVSLNLSAPRLVIPLELSVKGPYLVLDLGKLKCKTISEEEKGYQSYKLDLTDLESFIVWDWEDVKSIRSTSKDYLLKPSNSRLSLLKDLNIDYKKPGIILKLVISCISLKLDEKKIKFLFEIKENYSNAIQQEFEDPIEVNEVFNPKRNSFSMGNAQLASGLALYSLKNNLASSFYYTKAQKKELQNLSPTFPFNFSIELEEFVTKIEEKGEKLTKVLIKSFLILAKRNQQSEVDLFMKISAFNIKDLRAARVFSEVVSNPSVPLLSPEKIDGLKVSNPKIQTENNQNSPLPEPQLKISLKSDPRKHFLDIGLSLSELRFTLSRIFLESTYRFYNSHILPNLSVSVPAKDIDYDMTYITNSRFSINLKSIEVALSLDDPSERVCCLNSTLMMVYSTQSKSTHYYTSDHQEVSRVYKSCTEEADLTFSHSSLVLLDADLQRSSKEILIPCRFSVEYHMNRDDVKLTYLVQAQVRLESLNVLLSVTDFQYFQKLVAWWSSINFPKQNQKGIIRKESSEVFTLNTEESQIDEKNKESLSCVAFDVDADSFQLAIVDDTDDEIVSLVSLKVSNISARSLNQDRRINVEVDVILWVDYFNKFNGAWEPAVEDWKFHVKTILHENNKKSVFFKSVLPLNVNLTENFVEVLSVLNKKITSTSKPEKTETEILVKSHSNLEYEVENHLEIPIFVSIGSPSEDDTFKVEKDSPCYFSQEYINKKMHKTNKKILKSKFFNSVQAPCKLRYGFSESSLYFDNSTRKTTENYKVNEIPIDQVGLSIIKCEFQDKKYKILVKISVRDGKRLIIFEAPLQVFNHSRFEFLLTLEEENIQVFPFKHLKLPIHWFKNSDKIKVDGKDLNRSSELEIESFPVVIMTQNYKISQDQKLEIIEISPGFYVKNSLFCEILIKNSSGFEIIINPGEEIEFQLERKSLYMIQLEINGCLMVTKPFNLFQKEKFECLFEEWSHSSILVESYEKVHENLKELSTYSKEINKSLIKSWVILVYSEYIIVNKSQFDLEMSGLVLPRNQNRFYSGKNKSQKLKLGNSTSKSSSSFNIHTIGTSKQVKISQSSIPKHLLFGVNVSRAPGHLITKVVSIVPRFLIWNSLNIPINIKQMGFKSLETLHPRGDPLQFHFEDYSKSKKISISDAQIENHDNSWSAAFKIESVNDFQVKVLSNPTEAEEKLNIFLKGWFIPSKSDLSRFVRVYIHSLDEATIHIVLMEPKVPECTINNKTEENFSVKQKGTKTQYELPSNKVLYWAWDDLDKKQVLVFSYGKKNVSVNIEDYTKKPKILFKKFKIINRIVNASREIVIQDEKEEEIPEIPVSDIKYSKYATAKKFTRSDTLKSLKKHSSSNQGFSLFKLSKDQKTKNEIQFYLKEIGISVFDKGNNEMFFINFKEFLFQIRKERVDAASLIKEKTSVNFKLEHFQIDYMGNKTKLFPVVFYPVRHDFDLSRAEMGENSEDCYYFFTFVMDMESKKSLKRGKVVASADTYNYLSIFLNKFHLKVNDETIYIILKFKDFFNCFYSDDSQTDLGTPVYSTAIPSFRFDHNTFQSKSYFKYVSIADLSFFITFKIASSEKKSTQKYNNDLFIVNLIKSLGGALVNVNESPVSFNIFLLSNTFMSFPSFISLLLSSYKSKGISQFYKIFGSIDIIGNPMLLIGSIGRGLYDFFASPIKGLKSRNRGGFIKGIGKGVKSLLSGVVGGTFGSISKFSGSLYNVLKSATDEKVEQREISTNDIGKNMVFGLKDCAKDLAIGVSNFAVKPYKGAKNRKIKGFFQGFMTGTFGLVMTPVKVALKLSNVVSTTVASTSELIAKGKIKTFGRSRFARYLGVNKVLTCYSKEVSQVQQLMRNISKSCGLKRESLVFHSSFVFGGKVYVVMVTTNFLVYLVDGEVMERVKVVKVKSLELHVFERVYFLGIRTEKKKFVIFNEKLFDLMVIFDILMSQRHLGIEQGENGFLIPDLFWNGYLG